MLGEPHIQGGFCCVKPERKGNKRKRMGNLDREKARELPDRREF